MLTEKKIKIKEIAEHRTAANPPQKPTHKAQSGGYAAVQSFDAMKKKPRSSTIRKEINLKMYCIE
jgi:hypothetical protein